MTKHYQSIIVDLLVFLQEMAISWSLIKGKQKFIIFFAFYVT